MNKTIVLLIAAPIFWLILSDLDFASLSVGTVFIGLSVFALHYLSTDIQGNKAAYQIQPLRIPHFTVYFLHQSILGGLDISKRALSANLSLSPELVRYPIRKELEGSPTSVLLTIISLMPGSLSVLRDSKELVVHTLTAPEQTRTDLLNCENQVAKLFNIAVPANTQSRGLDDEDY
ncbi:Na+/H+ antiporter subunit E [Ningiella sp. W23]|uniref:Na+/H+ antiporter subunit E n=1 Tax=Ningiella sp. W23 TaxID=3023715 RepID=UPI0037562F85